MNRTTFVISLLIFDLSLICSAEEKVIVQNPPVKTQLSRSEKMTPIALSDDNKYNDSTLYTTVGVDNSIDPKKLPRVRTQDGMPLCQTFCPTTLVEFKLCEERKIEDCSTIPDEQRISPLSTLSYRDTEKPKDESVIGNIATSGGKQAFQVMNTIASAAGSQIFYPESCLPFNEFVDKFKQDESALNNYLETINVLYNSSKTKFDTEASVESCQDCLKLKEKLKLFLPQSDSLDEIATALKLKDFKSFMYSMVFRSQKKINPTCKRIEFEKILFARHFPGPTDKVISTLDQVFEKMDDVLSKKKPVILSPLCVARKQFDKSCDYHCLVITGRKRVRHKITNDEVEVVRIHNSWGEKWQEENNDGWVPLENLKSAMTTYDDQNAEHPTSKRKIAYGYSISWFD